MKRKLNERDVPEVVTELEGKPEEQKKSEKLEKPKKTASAFSDLGLDPRLLQAITKEKFATPTQVQAKAIPLALAGKDVLGALLVWDERWSPSTDICQHVLGLALARQLPMSYLSSNPF